MSPQGPGHIVILTSQKLTLREKLISATLSLGSEWTGQISPHIGNEA